MTIARACRPPAQAFCGRLACRWRIAQYPPRLSSSTLPTRVHRKLCKGFRVRHPVRRVGADASGFLRGAIMGLHLAKHGMRDHLERQR